MAAWIIEPRNPIERIAVHEAGHTVVAWHVRTVLEFQVVSLRIRELDGNAATLYRSAHHPPLSYWEAIAISMGGIAGVFVGLNDFSPEGAGSDIERAVAEARVLVQLHPDTECPWRLSADVSSRRIKIVVGDDDDHRINHVLESCFTHARQTIARHRPMFTQLIGELVCRKRLTGRQLERLFGERPWVVSSDKPQNS